MDADQLINGLAWYMVFLFSTCFHEAAHAWTALRLGDRTAYLGGQVSLNPVPHIRREVLGMVVVPIVSFLSRGWIFGWASAPMDLAWTRRNPRKSAWVSLAGPLANLTLLVAAAVLIRIGLQIGWFVGPERISFTHVVEGRDSVLGAIGLVLGIFFNLNLILFCFNLLPLPPMDGSGAIGLLMSDEAAAKTQEVMSQPTFALIGLIVAWQFFGYLFRPIFSHAVDLLYWGIESYGA